jgi:hypothetical protein
VTVKGLFYPMKTNLRSTCNNKCILSTRFELYVHYASDILYNVGFDVRKHFS